MLRRIISTNTKHTYKLHNCTRRLHTAVATVNTTDSKYNEVCKALQQLLKQEQQHNNSKQHNNITFNNDNSNNNNNSNNSNNNNNNSSINGSTSNTGLLRDATPTTTTSNTKLNNHNDGIDYLSMAPSEIVRELNRYIIGQDDAKRAVAIACRQRWRRQKLPDHLKQDVTPNNILMIGPTGCGKTEIARRLAKLTGSPFVRVEATKYTEVGFYGKDVDTIIQDLMRAAYQLEKQKHQKKQEAIVNGIVERKIIEGLIGPNADERTFNNMLNALRLNLLEQVDCPINIPSSNKDKSYTDQINSVVEAAKFTSGLGNFTSSNTPGITSSGSSMSFTQSDNKKQYTVKEVRQKLSEFEYDRLIDNEDILKSAVYNCENNGIVFIDEIDKIASDKNDKTADASSVGVQRDLLPLIEGTAILFKQQGFNINTDHILFICSGAFHTVKPTDLLAELQGRLPIRVELRQLDENDMYRILRETEQSVIKQNIQLLSAEKIKLSFTDDAVRQIAHIATEVNRSVANIGARRLATVVETIVSEISYLAPDMKPNTEIVVDTNFVNVRTKDLMKSVDLQKYIL